MRPSVINKVYFISFFVFEECLSEWPMGGPGRVPVAGSAGPHDCQLSAAFVHPGPHVCA